MPSSSTRTHYRTCWKVEEIVDSSSHGLSPFLIFILVVATIEVGIAEEGFEYLMGFLVPKARVTEGPHAYIIFKYGVT
jgi:hypothetical protein